MKTKRISWLNLSVFEISAILLAVSVFLILRTVSLAPTQKSLTFTATQPLVVSQSISKPVAKSVAPVAPIAAPQVKPLPIIPPQLVNQVIPVYPEKAVREEIEGTVLLNLRVGADGKIVETHVKRSSGAEILDTAAVKAAANWLFVPAKRGAEGISTIFEVPVSFVLNN